MPDTSHFFAWFPEFDQNEADAKPYEARLACEAAEKAAGNRCHRDVEYRDLVVHVRTPGGEVTSFDVEVVCRPEYVAKERLKHSQS